MKSTLSIPSLAIEVGAVMTAVALGVAIAALGGPPWLGLGLASLALAYLILLLWEETKALYLWHRQQAAKRVYSSLPPVERQRVAVMIAGEMLKQNYLKRGWYEDANAAGEAVFRLEREALGVIRAGRDVSDIGTMFEIGAATDEERDLVFELAGLYTLERRVVAARRQMEGRAAA